MIPWKSQFPRIVFAAVLAATGCKDYVPAGPDAGGLPESGGPETSRATTGEAGPGAACWADTDCADGHCERGCGNEGYCTRTGCTADRDCAVQGDSATYCCQSDGVCQRSRNASCGSAAGSLGEACPSGLDADCASGLFCTDECLVTPHCSRVCSSDDECDDAADLSCLPISDGGQACVLDPDKVSACDHNADCGSRAVCGLSYSWDSQDVLGLCASSTDVLGVGRSCLSEGQAYDQLCGAGWCWSGGGYSNACSALCTSDSDCTCGSSGCVVRQQTCVPFAFDLGEAAGISVVHICYEGNRCVSDDDCPSTRYCGVLDMNEELVLLCVPLPGGSSGQANGAACTTDDDCLTSLCRDGFCTGPCSDDPYCAAVREGSVCTLSALPYGDGGLTEQVNLCRTAT